MIVTAKTNIEKFEKNLCKQNTFLSKKMRCEYLSCKDITLDNFYCSDNVNIMLNGENASICGTPTEDEIENILSFCQFLRVYGLETEIDDLPIKNRHILHLMNYASDMCQGDETIIHNKNIYQFSEFCTRNFDDISFDMIYSFFARKVNRGLSDIYYIEKGGKIVSGAVASNYEETIYVSFVSTEISERGNGLASKIIRHVISENAGKEIILMCEENLIGFYEKLGFYNSGNINLYKVREESI